MRNLVVQQNIERTDKALAVRVGSICSMEICSALIYLLYVGDVTGSVFIAVNRIVSLHYAVAVVLRGITPAQLINSLFGFSENLVKRSTVIHLGSFLSIRVAHYGRFWSAGLNVYHPI